MHKNCHQDRRVMLKTLLILSINCIGNAFIPSLFGLEPRPALAMSADSTSTKPISTEKIHNMCSDDGTNNNIDQKDSTNTSDEVLLLPPNDSTDPSIPRIKLGDTISFEEMGPVIINADGSTRRIDNWDKMTKQEQEVAWRRISKRNEARRAALLEQQKQANEHASRND